MNEMTLTLRNYNKSKQTLRPKQTSNNTELEAQLEKYKNSVQGMKIPRKFIEIHFRTTEAIGLDEQ